MKEPSKFEDKRYLIINYNIEEKNNYDDMMNLAEGFDVPSEKVTFIPMTGIREQFKDLTEELLLLAKAAKNTFLLVHVFGNSFKDK